MLVLLQDENSRKAVGLGSYRHFLHFLRKVTSVSHEILPYNFKGKMHFSALNINTKPITSNQRRRTISVLSFRIKASDANFLQCISICLMIFDGVPPCVGTTHGDFYKATVPNQISKQSHTICENMHA